LNKKPTDKPKNHSVFKKTTVFSFLFLNSKN
jgi:hypothetical protein